MPRPLENDHDLLAVTHCRQVRINFRCVKFEFLIAVTAVHIECVVGDEWCAVLDANDVAPSLSSNDIELLASVDDSVRVT